MTKTILTYCSLPLLYSLHSFFSQAIEKRWSQFPNRYKDANVDIIYETKETKYDHHNIHTSDTFHNVRFLRPPKLQGHKCLYFTDRKDTLYNTLRWTKLYESIMIRVSDTTPIRYIANNRWSRPFYAIPSVSRFLLLASKGRQGYSLKELHTIANHFQYAKSGWKKEDLAQSLLRLYEMNSFPCVV
jgi:hypothetical protein